MGTWILIFAGIIMSWAGLSPWKWESHGRVWDAIQGLSTEGGGVQNGTHRAAARSSHGSGAVKRGGGVLK